RSSERAGNAGGKHQLTVARAIIDEHVEHRAHVVRRDPGMRHVADETQLARRAAHDLGPLVPAGRALILHEINDELARAVWVPKTQKSPYEAQLVGRVVRPTC